MKLTLLDERIAVKAIEAAEDAFAIFAEWRSKKPDREKLRLRCSIHFTAILITRYPGYWTSDDLNLFAKHERDIGLAGTVAITKVIREHLSDKFEKKFPEKTLRELINIKAPKDSRFSKVYHMPIESELQLAQSAEQRLSDWLKKIIIDDMQLEQRKDIGPKDYVKFILDGAALIFASPTTETNYAVELKKIETGGPLKTLPLNDEERKRYKELIEKVQAEANKSEQGDTWKVSPTE